MESANEINEIANESQPVQEAETVQSEGTDQAAPASIAGLNPGIASALTVDEANAMEAESKGMTVEELLGNRQILANTPQVQAPDTLEAKPFEGAAEGAAEVVAVPLGVQLGRVGNLETVLANRLTDKGWANVPVVIQHLDNGTSRELTADELAVGGQA